MLRKLYLLQNTKGYVSWYKTLLVNPYRASELENSPEGEWGEYSIHTYITYYLHISTYVLSTYLIIITYWHGLRTPNEAFFHQNPKVMGLGRQFVQINFPAFGAFSADLSAPILVQWVPCPCFPLINHYFYNKLSLYIRIQKIYLGLGFEFEFGPQRVRDLAIVCL